MNEKSDASAATKTFGDIEMLGTLDTRVE